MLAQNNATCKQTLQVMTITQFHSCAVIVGTLLPVFIHGKVAGYQDQHKLQPNSQITTTLKSECTGWCMYMHYYEVGLTYNLGILGGCDIPRRLTDISWMYGIYLTNMNEYFKFSLPTKPGPQTSNNSQRESICHSSCVPIQVRNWAKSWTNSSLTFVHFLIHSKTTSCD